MTAAWRLAPPRPATGPPLGLAASGQAAGREDRAPRPERRTPRCRRGWIDGGPSAFPGRDSARQANAPVYRRVAEEERRRTAMPDMSDVPKSDVQAFRFEDD